MACLSVMSKVVAEQDTAVVQLCLLIELVTSDQTDTGS